MKFFKPAKILCPFLTVMISFTLVVFWAGFSGASKTDMVAGVGILPGWGVFSAIGSLLVAAFIVRMIEHAKLVKFNRGLFVLVILLIGDVYDLWPQGQKSNEEQLFPQTKPIQLASYRVRQTNQTSKMGIGFFQPNFYQSPKLNFYGRVNLEKSLDEHLPEDSLVFTQTELGLNTTYAPAWLFPEHMKVDYGIIMLKVLGYGGDFLKVETNKQTGQFHYVDKSQGRFITWPEMLMSVNSIEPLNPSQPIHIKPLPNASQVTTAYEFLLPLLVEGDWIYVRLVDEKLNDLGKGWIRWQDKGLLLIRYSLLS